MAMDSYLILDLDGTIADDRRRLPLIDHSSLDPWRAYHEDCANDPVINRGLFQDFPGKLLIFTSRPRYVFDETVEWLEYNRIPAAGLWMRENDCRMSSPDLKAYMWYQCREKLGIDERHVEMAFDDRLDVIRMWRYMGIAATHITCTGGGGSYDERVSH